MNKTGNHQVIHPLWPIPSIWQTEARATSPVPPGSWTWLGLSSMNLPSSFLSTAVVSAFTTSCGEEFHRLTAFCGKNLSHGICRGQQDKNARNEVGSVGQDLKNSPTQAPTTYFYQQTHETALHLGTSLSPLPPITFSASSTPFGAQGRGSQSDPALAKISPPTPHTSPKMRPACVLNYPFMWGKQRGRKTRDCSPCCGAETADLGARAPLKLVRVGGESWGDSRALVSFVPQQLGSAARGVMGSIPPKKGSPHQITPKLLPGLGPVPSPAVSQKMPMIQTVWGQVP